VTYKNGNIRTVAAKIKTHQHSAEGKQKKFFVLHMGESYFEYLLVRLVCDTVYLHRYPRKVNEIVQQE